MLTFRVDGMECGGCSRSITAAIRAVEPAADVAVDLPAGTVRVTGAGDDDGPLVRAIEDAGFTVTGREV